MQDFRHLIYWQRGHAMGMRMHKVARGFSRAGYHRLRVQLTGSAESIADNIVEGCGAASNKEFDPLSRHVHQVRDGIGR
jgi:four helix bundle protein